ncbi:BTB/POZ domain-containing protein 17-like [Sinocyclocheilus rhinocerous]|uniref:BTB/POZ domain-containing protein 17-like n=1 Tax=Sinocyclocheilus rhinocerous TaxID=307959 RepID=UPI0007B95714|nr:PREDICTED: BTB/POZ domain-containing protein 17-like [Sinocyclocheilus rhinocerous]
MAYLLGNGLHAHIYLLFLLLAAGSHVQPVYGGLRAEGLVEGTTEVISHSHGLVARLEGLLVLGNNSDISLRVETVDADEVKVIQAHTLVLSLQSRVFEEMLRNRNSSTLVLRETAECTAMFEKFIRYLYCGELALQLDQATPLHRLATKYGISSLQQGLTQYMSQNLASDSLGGHVVGWYQYATSVGDTALRDNCLQFLAWNLSSVLQSVEWPSVSVELLTTLLQRSDLVLKNELELFEALEIWLTRNDPNTLTAENALRLVRYAMIPPRELFRLQRQSAIMTRYHESVRDLLYTSYQFHSASPLQLAKFFDVNCSLFVPRNYLSSMWGSQWVISNPARDDRSTSFQTQLGPSGFDSSKRVTWNTLFSPRWLPLSMRPMYTEQGAMLPPQPDGGSGIARPRVIITPATSSADFAGVSFQKTVLILTKQKNKLVVRHIFGFHQSTEEVGDFLLGEDLQYRTSEYLVDGSLYLHIIVKPIYQTLIATKK